MFVYRRVTSRKEACFSLFSWKSCTLGLPNINIAGWNIPIFQWEIHRLKVSSIEIPGRDFFEIPPKVIICNDVNKHSHGKFTILDGIYHKRWGFSWAMLVFGGVLLPKILRLEPKVGDLGRGFSFSLCGDFQVNRVCFRGCTPPEN